MCVHSGRLGIAGNYSRGCYFENSEPFPDLPGGGSFFFICFTFYPIIFPSSITFSQYREVIHTSAPFILCAVPPRLLSSFVGSLPLFAVLCPFLSAFVLLFVRFTLIMRASRFPQRSALTPGFNPGKEVAEPGASSHNTCSGFCYDRGLYFGFLACGQD